MYNRMVGEEYSSDCKLLAFWQMSPVTGGEMSHICNIKHSML